LKLAKRFGAKWVLNASSSGRESAPTDKSAFRIPHSAFPLDAAIVAVPSDAAVHQALQLVRGGGQVLLFAHTKRADGRSQMADGVPPSTNPNSHLPSSIFQIDLASICVDEKDLIGSYSSDFTLQAEVARLVFARQFDVRPLITHRFPLDETAAAVQLAARPQPDSLKIFVEIAS